MERDSMTININLIVLIIIILLAIAAVVTFINKKRQKNQHSDQVAEYDNDQIYVGNLPYTVNEADLRQYFNQYGAIEYIKMVKNHKTGRSKGYAFITYGSKKEAVKSLTAHGHDMQGRNMVVRIAKPR